LPGPVPRSLAESPAIANALVSAGADKVVECGFCRVSGLSSQIPETAGGEHRCSGIDECVQRSIEYYANGGQQPRPLVTFPVTALEPLPKREPAASFVAEPLPQPEPPVPSDDDIDAHLETFHALHDAQDEAEKATGEPEAAGPGHSPACERGDHDDCTDPLECACEHHEQDAAHAAVALAAHLGPDEPGFGPETCTEDEEPAEDRAPASVAEGFSPDQSDPAEG
jgi:hypothetical protein